MPVRKDEEYNFVGLARSPVKQTPTTAGYYSSHTMKSGSSSAGETDVMSSASSYSRVLRPIPTNACEPQTPTCSVASSVSTTCKSTVPESACRSSILVSRALRLSPATEEKKGAPGHDHELASTRAPLFVGDVSPVSNARTGRSMPSTGRRFSVLSPLISCSRRSPVPAFTPGFDMDDVLQPPTPAASHECSSRRCGSENDRTPRSDDGAWTDFSFSGTSSALDPVTPAKSVRSVASSREGEQLALASAFEIQM